MIPCTYCERDTPDRYLEKHHLTPRCKNGKETTSVCIDCGDQIHNLFTNKELEHQYNTVEKLKSHPKMQAWIRWIRKRKEFGFCMKAKKKK